MHCAARIVRIIAFLSALVALALAQSAAAFTPSHLWSRQFNTANPNVRAVTFDATGNVIVAGYFTGTINLGGATLTSAGSYDIFIAKYSAFGVYQWSFRYGSTGSDQAFSLGTDASSNIYMSGSFQGTVGFGGTALVSLGGTDVFVARYFSDGSPSWSHSYGGTADENGFQLAVIPTGVVVIGYFSGTANFGGSALTSAGSVDTFLAKYNSGGVHVFSNRYGGTMEDVAQDVAVDASSGNIVLTGYYYGTTNFGGGSMTNAGTSTDIVMARYNSSGGFLSQLHYGSTGIDEGSGVAIDASGNIFTTGRFEGTVSLGGTLLVTSPGTTDVYLAKYTSGGSHVWSKKFGGANANGGAKVAIDFAGNLLATGYYNGTADFGGGPLPAVGSTDAFLAKFTTIGAPIWSQHFGDKQDDNGRDVACDANGTVALVGTFNTAIDLGGQLLTANTYDDFVATFAPGASEPVISSIVDIKNDQGRAVKVTFTASGEDDPRAFYYATQYEAYRRSDPAPLQVASSPADGAAPRPLLDSGWTQAGVVSAHGKKTYSIDVPTIGDSTLTLGQYYSVFKIRAATQFPYEFYDSPPDSGYSKDNLAPGVPQNFVLNTGQLTWDESTAPDFKFFTVYGSNTTSFANGVLINYTIAHAMDVHAATYPYYFVTARDFSGNEGNPALANNPSGVGETPRSYVLSVSNYPNPFNPATTVKYTVPQRGRVRVAIYDARGALVTTLVDKERAAAAYSIDWKPGAAVGSGVYFARIEQNGATRTHKLVLLK
jgi:hypothetical protein